MSFLIKYATFARGSIDLSNTLRHIQTLIGKGDIRISDHGFNELTADNISIHEVIAGINMAILVEDYPDYPKGSCCFVLQCDKNGVPIHVVWGIPRGASKPAVLVTAYRPDKKRWSIDFLRRLSDN